MELGLHYHRHRSRRLEVRLTPGAPVRRQQVLRMAEANKAFARYRW